MGKQRDQAQRGAAQHKPATKRSPTPSTCETREVLGALGGPEERHLLAYWGFVTHFIDNRQPTDGQNLDSDDSGSSGEVRYSEVPESSRIAISTGTAEAGQRQAEDEFETTESVVVRKNARLKAKVDVARAHLQRLPKSDRRSRLLHAAVVRRDEVLLDALLQELESSQRKS